MAFLHGKNTKILIGGYDLSGYFNKTSWKATAAALDVTTFGKSAKVVIGGLLDSTVSLEGFYDPSTAAVDQILAAALGANDTVATMFPQADTIGNPGFGVMAVETSYDVADDVTAPVSCTAELQSEVGRERTRSIHALGLETAIATYASCDDLAASANGIDAYLQVTAATALTTATILVEHSTDNTTFTTVATFANVTAAPNAQRIVVAGAVNRYVRARLSVLTGTNLTFQVAYNRN